MPFKARIVTLETFEQEEKQENLLKEMNINPFTFERCAKNNYDGVTIYLSPFDLKCYLSRHPFLLQLLSLSPTAKADQFSTRQKLCFHLYLY
jgi:hypothetical protein